MLKKLLEEVARGDVDPQSALERLRHLPISEVPEAQATLDTHRALRTGYPEVVLGSSKTPEQIIAIARRMLELDQTVLVTRIDPPVADRLLHALEEGEYDPLGRTYIARRGPAQKPRGKLVLVITAGTSDTPVAQEALVTARLMGANVERIDDVGVAGLHRITRHTERLQHAGVLVVVAGMDGALPSVVAGLSGRPVVAVPTSVGYGASFGGIAALLGMLNSCAPGVSVVNIDNGFGAGQLAALLARDMS